MAIDFENPLTAGTVLVRDAIQSQNYSPAAAGWRVGSDGTAEFSDLTIRSSDESGTTVEIANGVITITEADGTPVIEIDATGYGLYNADGDLVAAVVLDANEPPDPTVGGFYARGFQSQVGTSVDTWAFLAGGYLVASPLDGALVDTQGQLSYVCNTTGSYVEQILTTGSMDAATTNPARLRLRSVVGARPQAWIEGSEAGAAADLEVSGAVTGGNVSFVQPKTTRTTITSDATFTSDPELQLQLEAGSVYEVEFFISYATTTAAGFRTQWLVPSGTAGFRGAQGLGSSATSDNNAGMRSGIHGLGTNVEYGSQNSSSLFCMAQEKAILTTGANAGTLALQWAQLVSSADQTSVSEGSFLRVAKIG